MLTQMPTPKMIEEWKAIFAKYKSQLKANKKTAKEVIEYLQSKYPIEEITTDEVKQVVIDNITRNQPFAEKLPQGKELRPIVYTVLNKSNAVLLYTKQEDVFRGVPIIVGIELETGYVSVEGSGELTDELVAFQGLDGLDLKNYYLVANYITCLQKYGMLDNVLTRTK